MGEIATSSFTNNSVMLLKLNRSVMLIICTLHYYFSCIFTTVEIYDIYNPKVLLFLFLDFVPAFFLFSSQFATTNHTSFVIISLRCQYPSTYCWQPHLLLYPIINIVHTIWQDLNTFCDSEKIPVCLMILLQTQQQ